jgi:hypothetical protein
VIFSEKSGSGSENGRSVKMKGSDLLHACIFAEMQFLRPGLLKFFFQAKKLSDKTVHPV